MGMGNGEWGKPKIITAFAFAFAFAFACYFFGRQAGRQLLQLPLVTSHQPPGENNENASKRFIYYI